ncbi:Holliday junction branch migration protein RuvA [Candidatus Gottesmanbacteria bacterium]|nr:Holliday junction branch migration protein RuvA [Candidatus Gottesmanbacteria bacterium]
MIGALRGEIFSSLGNQLILMVHDVGYRISVPQKLVSTSNKGGNLTLFIHTHVRDDALDLYGFITQEELALFELLLTVSGIGPRTALAIIDRGVAAIRAAVASADVTFFTTVPRVGTKNAQKIIIELKNKLGSVTELDLAAGATGDTKDVLEALTNMGFGRSEVLEVIKRLDPALLSVEDKIRQALKLL